ncbi:SDR family oxidoreductase [Sphingomonas sp.]|uniref:SDR family oxidoreductase n=1 Tax=Sphingomonas sp. TaxID=28214 RepID=UPI00185C87BD|nr:SDR family oxidoreductase [Sphingomonas sp.]MBA3510813.1 SDR family oxidoreductase [Sphingomonas sp.]
MPSVLITGTNRGIGLEFARQYSAAGWQVIATARETSAELAALEVGVETLDLRDLDAVASLAASIEHPLDLLIANAGTMLPETGETAADGNAWAEMMVVNCIAPYVLAKALLGRVADARGKLIAISSGMGSIAESSGGYAPYRTSKAALNMAWHSLAIEAKPLGAVAATIDPGWVKTRMGGPNALIPAEQSVGEMRALIERVGADQSGGFLKRDGSPHPW